MTHPDDANLRWRFARRLTAALLTVWAIVGFGLVYFARALNAVVFFGWPLGYWIAAQGAMLGFLAIVVGYAWMMGREEDQEEDSAA